MNNPTCKRCNVPMLISQGYEQTYSGIPDFPGSTEACTMTPDGTSLAKCWKCPECGHSVTASKEDIQGEKK